MLYEQLLFRGNFIQLERVREEKQRLRAASFGAWQQLAPQMKRPVKWETYIKSLGLSDKPKISEKDIKREADHALANVQRIIAKARKNGSR